MILAVFAGPQGLHPFRSAAKCFQKKLSKEDRKRFLERFEERQKARGANKKDWQLDGISMDNGKPLLQDGRVFAGLS